MQIKNPVSFYSWDVPNLETWLIYTLCCYIAEPFSILLHCSGISCLSTLLSNSQSWNITDVYPIILHCWVAPFPKTLRWHSLFTYITELFPILKQCWCLPCLNTTSSCSAPWNIPVVYPVLLQCWVVRHPKTMMRHILFFFYIGELFPVLKQSRYTLYLITLWRWPQSWNMADFYFVLLRKCAILNVISLLQQISTDCLAELIPFLKNCRRISCLSWYFAETFPILKPCWRKPCFVTLLSYSPP